MRGLPDSAPDFLLDAITADSSARPEHSFLSAALDRQSIPRAAPDIDHERLAAMYDLVSDGCIEPASGMAGPFRLLIGEGEGVLEITLGDRDCAVIAMHPVRLVGLRSLIRDYLIVCENYYTAIKSAPPSRIEAIDMGRRGLHDDGAERLIAAFEPFGKIDHRTARCFFSLICALRVRS